MRIILPQARFHTLHDHPVFFIGRHQYGDTTKRNGLLLSLLPFSEHRSDAENEQIQYIDGETYKEGKDFPKISNAGLASKAISLGTGEYFVLGDNRNNSEDSRYTDIGLVKKRYIAGKIWFTCAPARKLGFWKG